MKDIFENPAPHVADVLSRTNWALLARQKRALLAVVHDSVAPGLLDGLIHFLDAIQDAAELDGYSVEYLTEEEGT